MTSITYTIDTQTTGENTVEENTRYALVLRDAIIKQYPDTAVNVELASGVNVHDRVEIQGLEDSDTLDETIEDIHFEAARVWSEANY